VTKCRIALSNSYPKIDPEDQSVILPSFALPHLLCTTQYQFQSLLVATIKPIEEDGLTPVQNWKFAGIKALSLLGHELNMTREMS
jgi:hypothetical protein